jgi:hypothetical protein
MNAEGVPMSNTSFTQIINALQENRTRNKPPHFINLEDRTIIPLSTAIRLIDNGVDNGILGGVPRDELMILPVE